MRRITRQPGGDSRGFSAVLHRSGVAGALLAGVLFVTWGYVHRSNAPPYLDAMSRVLNFIVPTLFLLGLLGLYVHFEKQRVGRVGRMGLVLALVGSAMGAAYAIPWSAFATRGDWLSMLARLDIVLVWGLEVMLIGVLLAGVAAVEARTSRGLGVLLLAMGLFGWAYYFSDSGAILEAWLVHVGFAILFSLSWMTLGLALLREGMS